MDSRANPPIAPLSGTDQPMTAEPVGLSDIPMPPQAIIDEVIAEEESGSAPSVATDAPTESAPPASAPRQPAPTAALDFLDPAAFGDRVTLKYPFRHEGREVHEIPIRRLTGGEVSDTLDRLETGDVTLIELYAAMTGFPADVLRGLVDEDASEVNRRAHDFLPSIWQSPDGEVSPEEQPSG